MTPQTSLRLRLTIIFLLILVGCIAIFVKAIDLKFVHAAQYRNKIEIREVKIPASRGNILARDGRKLACSIPSYQITMDPSTDGLPDSVFNKHITRLSHQLAGFFHDKTQEEYRKLITDARLRHSRYIKIGSRRVTHNELKVIRQFAIFDRGKNKGGLQVEMRNERVLPFGLLAKRTIGYLYQDREKGGSCGLEKGYNDLLYGVDGIGRRVRSNGRWLTEEVVLPRDGKDIVTTIDIDIQDVAESSLLHQLQIHDALKGVAILMEVKTGAIRAIANLTRGSDGRYLESYNTAIGELTEPGSTFKLATLMACLEDGKVTLEDTIDTYNGEFKIYDQTMRDSRQGGHGIITIREAFELSSNIAFSRLVLKHYGTDKWRFINRLHDLGLCDSLAIDILGEKQTEIKTPDSPTWSGTTLPWMSIGYEIRLTPLQLLTFYNAIANNGTMMRPMFVESIEQNGKRISLKKPHVMRNCIASRRTIETVQEALKGVVEHGTAMNIRATPYKIAGKTGTAQIAQDNSGYNVDGKKQYLASFAGYFPADDPLYSCVVMVYGPSRQVYYGNVVAGSVVKDIADRVYAAEFRKGSGKTQPEVPSSGVMPYTKGGHAADLLRVLSELKIPHNTTSHNSEWLSSVAEEGGVKLAPKHFGVDIMPDIRGMGAADAVSLLEKRGLRVRLAGAGRVKTQYPSPGVATSRGTLVELTLE